jgi:mono/diheme cytochrome c family protein
LDFVRRICVCVGFVAGVLLCALLVSGSRPAQAGSRTSREAGAEIFKSRGCEHCHGVDGVGTDKGPELTTVGKRWKGPRIEQQIVNGGNGMPAFGQVLQPDEVKSLVDFLKAKKKAPKVQAGGDPGAVAAAKGPSLR